MTDISAVRDGHLLVTYQVRDGKYYRLVHVDEYPKLKGSRFPSIRQAKSIWNTGNILSAGVAEVLLAERCGNFHPLLKSDSYMQLVENWLNGSEMELQNLTITSETREYILLLAQEKGLCMRDVMDELIFEIYERILL